MNRAIMLGNTGTDPKFKQINDNFCTCKISLATTKNWKNKDGEKQSKTEWHNLVFKNGLAKVVNQYVKKGDKLLVEGEVTYNKYEKDGETKYFTSINCSNMEMVRSKGENTSAPKTEKKEEGDKFEDIEDLPF